MKTIYKKWLLFSLIFLFQTCTHANQASTEYVNLVVQSLRNDIVGQVQSLLQGNSNLQNQINQLPIITHKIGEIFQGGMVFYVDETKQHGLIVSLNDLNSPVEWRNSESGDRIVNATNIGLGAGENNTRLIVSQQTADQQDGTFAALQALNYQVKSNGEVCENEAGIIHSLCIGGWFLPSIYELQLIYSNLKNKGLANFSDDYWSSSEIDTTQAWAFNFSSGHSIAQDKSYTAQVRAIHIF